MTMPSTKTLIYGLGESGLSAARALADRDHSICLLYTSDAADE